MKIKLLLALLLASLLPARAAQYRIYATVQITNTPAQGNILNVNGDLRYWLTNSVTNASMNILITNSIGGNTTNLNQHAGSYGFSGPLSIVLLATNKVQFVGATNQPLTITTTGTWATVTYTTNPVYPSMTLILPVTVLTNYAQTNAANWLVEAISGYATKPFTNGSLAMSGTLQTTGNQTNYGSTRMGGTTTISNVNILAGSAFLAGLTTISNASAFFIGGTVSNTDFRSVNIRQATGAVAANTNGGIIFYDATDPTFAIVSDSSGIPSIMQSPTLNTVLTNPANYVLADSSILIKVLADAVYAQLAGNNTFSGTNYFSQHLGTANLESTNGYASALRLSNPTLTNASDLIVSNSFNITNGVGSASLNLQSSNTFRSVVNYLRNGTNEWRLGLNATTNSLDFLRGLSSTVLSLKYDNQAAFGGNVTVPSLSVNGSANITNIDGMGFDTKINTSLANGNNTAVDISTNSDMIISPGPTAAYTIAGIAGGYPGRVLNIYSKIGFPWTIANESGGDPATNNRIVTLTGGDVTTLSIGAAQLIYDGSTNRWVLRQFSGYGTNVITTTTNGILSSYGLGTNTALTTATNHGKFVIDQSSAGDSLVVNSNLIYASNGKVGIGTTGPDSTLDVLHATQPQVRMTSADGSSFTTFQNDANGMRISATGAKFALSGDGVATPTGILDLMPATGGALMSFRQATVNTANATPTTLQTIAISISLTYLIEARVHARRTGGVAGTANDGAVYIRRCMVTTKAGTVTINAVQDGLTQEDNAALDCTFTVSGGNVLLQVTGDTSNNYTWYTTTTVQVGT